MILNGVIKTQVLVIGAGPGGAVTAAILAEAGRDVLVIEDGQDIALNPQEEFTPLEMTQKYRGGGLTLTWGKPKVTYVEGKVLGGGSEVNSGLYHRTPEEVLLRWQTEWGVRECSEPSLKEHFERIELDLKISVPHGPLPEPASRFQKGAEKLNWKSMEVPRWFSPGDRRSMSATYLPRARAAGARVLSGVRAEHLKKYGSGWQAECQNSLGEWLSIECEQVFCAAGAIHTPALLLRSDITRNIGKRLNLHPSVKVVAEFAERINGPQIGVPAHQIKEFAPEISMGCSISRPQHLALALMSYRDLIPQLPQRWQHMAAYYAMTPGEGKGSITPLPFFNDPVVRYQLRPVEFEHLRKGLHDLCRVLLAGGASAVYPSTDRGMAIRSEEELRFLEKIPDQGLRPMTIHLSGSCPMGEDKNVAAANSFGEVFDQNGLHIADASLLCTPPGVNPQGTIMAFARRNALATL